jgi:ubiquinone/menaquinone biosynthesis C-methylase UbiE
MNFENETDRITQAYERRQEHVSSQLYSFFNTAHLFIVQRRDREIIEALKMHGIEALEDKKILDIGCGGGRELGTLIRYGAGPDNLFGIDLLQNRIDNARRIHPHIDFRCADAASLPYGDDSFDIVMQFTVFTSILEIRMKREIAREIVRVLKPGGIILWYDYHMNNPKNPDVRGVKKKEIHELFPGCEIHLKRITLAPPLIRLIAPYSWLACYLLEKLKVFNTHYLGVIKKVCR